MITLSTSKPVSPFGRDLKGTFAALQSLLKTKAINFTLRLATTPFRSRRNIINLIRGILAPLRHPLFHNLKQTLHH